MVDQRAYKDLEDECDKLKKEVENLKMQGPQQKDKYDYLYSPTSTVATRERRFDEPPIY